MNAKMRMAVMGLCLVFSGSFLSAQAATLAERHVAKGVSCEACHGTKTPAEGAEVSTEKCSSCHGTLKQISEKIHQKGKAQSPDPHMNHSIGLNCNECHRGHEASVNMCNRCHVFKYNVP